MSEKQNGKSKSSPESKASKPQTKRIAAQDVMLQAIGSAKRMELEDLVKASRKIEPSKEESSYRSIARHEFVVLNEGDKTFILPEISEQGLQFAARYCVQREGSHWTLRRRPSQVLNPAKKLEMNATQIKLLEKLIADEKSEAKKEA